MALTVLVCYTICQYLSSYPTGLINHVNTDCSHQGQHQMPLNCLVICTLPFTDLWTHVVLCQPIPDPFKTIKTEIWILHFSWFSIHVRTLWSGRNVPYGYELLIGQKMYLCVSSEFNNNQHFLKIVNHVDPVRMINMKQNRTKTVAKF